MRRYPFRLKLNRHPLSAIVAVNRIIALLDHQDHPEKPGTMERMEPMVQTVNLVQLERHSPPRPNKKAAFNVRLVLPVHLGQLVRPVDLEKTVNGDKTDIPVRTVIQDNKAQPGMRVNQERREHPAKMASRVLMEHVDTVHPVRKVPMEHPVNLVPTAKLVSVDMMDKLVHLVCRGQLGNPVELEETVDREKPVEMDHRAKTPSTVHVHPEQPKPITQPRHRPAMVVVLEVEWFNFNCPVVYQIRIRPIALAPSDTHE